MIFNLTGASFKYCDNALQEGIWAELFEAELASGRGQGGGSPGEHWAGVLRETGEERQEKAGSGISTRAGTWREIQKGKGLLFFTAYDPLKNMKSLTFFDFHLAPPRL